MATEKSSTCTGQDTFQVGVELNFAITNDVGGNTNEGNDIHSIAVSRTHFEFEQSICVNPSTDPTICRTLVLDHKNISDGYFASSVRSTGLENQNNISANTYSIIGALNAEEWRREDGRFWFEMIYKYCDGASETLLWAQESWLTSSSILGADLFGVPAQTVEDSRQFYGLGLSTRTDKTYLDGDSGAFGQVSWWNSAGTLEAYSGGIPAFNGKIACGVSLYILRAYHVIDRGLCDYANVSCSPTTLSTASWSVRKSR